MGKILLGPHAQAGHDLAQMQHMIASWIDFAPPDLMGAVKARGGVNIPRAWVSEGDLKAGIYGGEPEATAGWYFQTCMDRFWNCSKR